MDPHEKLEDPDNETENKITAETLGIVPQLQ